MNKHLPTKPTHVELVRFVGWLDVHRNALHAWDKKVMLDE